jgi:hypothetical protein
MLPRIELGLQESESYVVTMLTIAPLRGYIKEEAIFRTFFGTDRKAGGGLEKN